MIANDCYDNSVPTMQDYGIATAGSADMIILNNIAYHNRLRAFYNAPGDLSTDIIMADNLPDFSTAPAVASWSIY